MPGTSRIESNKIDENVNWCEVQIVSSLFYFCADDRDTRNFLEFVEFEYISFCLWDNRVGKWRFSHPVMDIVDQCHHILFLLFHHQNPKIKIDSVLSLHFISDFWVIHGSDAIFFWKRIFKNRFNWTIPEYLVT